MRSLRALLRGYDGKPLRQVGKFKKLGTDPLSVHQRLCICDLSKATLFSRMLEQPPFLPYPTFLLAARGRPDVKGRVGLGSRSLKEPSIWEG